MDEEEEGEEEEGGVELVSEGDEVTEGAKSEDEEGACEVCEVEEEGADKEPET